MHACVSSAHSAAWPVPPPCTRTPRSPAHTSCQKSGHSAQKQGQHQLRTACASCPEPRRRNPPVGAHPESIQAASPAPSIARVRACDRGLVHHASAAALHAWRPLHQVEPAQPTAQCPQGFPPPHQGHSGAAPATNPMVAISQGYRIPGMQNPRDAESLTAHERVTKRQVVLLCGSAR